MKTIDITNKRFGHLTAIEVVGTGEKRLWRCRCDCGSYKDIITYCLLSGNNTSCGCKSPRNFKRLIGKKYGNLTVLSIEKNQGNKTTTKCLCDCGEIVIVRANRLYKGKKDCGCVRKKAFLLNGGSNKKDELPQLINKVYNSYKRNADKRKIKFELEKHDFIKVISENCFYCGELPKNIMKLRDVSLLWNGVDRKNNDIGYNINNVVACCTDCNFFKSTRGFDDFIEKISKIYKNLNCTRYKTHDGYHDEE